MTQHEIEKFIAFLAETPVTISKLVKGLGDDAVRQKLSVNEFSILEHICHLRDIEREGYKIRIERLLAETGPFLPDIDGSGLARKFDYNNQKLKSALSSFTVAREENLVIIRNLSAEQLTRNGMLENVGEVTLDELLKMMRRHDEEHLQVLTVLREPLLKDIKE